MDRQYNIELPCTFQNLWNSPESFGPLQWVVFPFLRDPSSIPFEQYEPILVGLDSRQFSCLFRLIIDGVDKGLIDRLRGSEFIYHCWLFLFQLHSHYPNFGPSFDKQGLYSLMTLFFSVCLQYSSPEGTQQILSREQRQEITGELLLFRLSLVFGIEPGVENLPLVQFYLILLKGLHCFTGNVPSSSQSEIYIGNIITDLFSYLEALGPIQDRGYSVKPLVTNHALASSALSLSLLENELDNNYDRILKVNQLATRITSDSLSLSLPPVVDLFTTNRPELMFLVHDYPVEGGFIINEWQHTRHSIQFYLPIVDGDDIMVADSDLFPEDLDPSFSERQNSQRDLIQRQFPYGLSEEWVELDVDPYHTESLFTFFIVDEKGEYRGFLTSNYYYMGSLHKDIFSVPKLVGSNGTMNDRIESDKYLKSFLLENLNKTKKVGSMTPDQLKRELEQVWLSLPPEQKRDNGWKFTFYELRRYPNGALLYNPCDFSGGGNGLQVLSAFFEGKIEEVSDSIKYASPKITHVSGRPDENEISFFQPFAILPVNKPYNPYDVNSPLGEYMEYVTGIGIEALSPLVHLPTFP